MTYMHRFSGKVAVVTGAGSGIGAAVAMELLMYDLIVVGLDIKEDKLQELSNLQKNGTIKNNFFYKKCDVSQQAEIAETFRWINDEIGLVTILINCAGVLIRRTLFDVDDDDISRTLNINIKGLLLCCKEAMKLMVKNEVDGHIININSINGHYIRKRNGISSTMVYAASKHGVTVLTEGLRQEIVNRNLHIKCTSISPGGVRTPLSDEGRENMPTSSQVLEPKNVAEACIAALNTPPNVLISELTVMGIHQEI